MNNLYEKNLLFFKTYHYNIYEKLSYNSSNLKKDNINFISKEGIFDGISLEVLTKNYLQNTIFTKETKKSIKNIQTIIKHINPPKGIQPKVFKTIVLGINNNFYNLISKDVKTILIVEPNINIFYTSLFIIDWSNLATKYKIFFSIDDNDIQINNILYNFFQYNFNFNYAIQYILSNQQYTFLYDSISIALMQNNPLTHSYYTKLLAYKNKIKNTLKYKSLDITKQLFTKKETILIVSIGPSINNSIKMIKQNRNKLILVAFAQSLHLLEQHHIIPDIITISDSSSKMKKFFQVKNQDIFKKSILFANNEVAPKILKKFKQNNIFLFDKTDDKILGTTIGEITYHLLLKLGGDNIHLAGVDLAFDKNNKLYSNNHIYIKDKTISKDTTNPHNIYITQKGNLRKKVKTNLFFKSLIENYNSISIQYKNRKVFNLSDGAYLHHTTPTKKLKLNKKQSKVTVKKQHIKNIYFDKNILVEEINFLNSIYISYNPFTKEQFIKDINYLVNTILTVSNPNNHFAIQRQHILFNYFNTTINFINYFLYSGITFDYNDIFIQIQLQLEDIIKKYKKILDTI